MENFITKIKINKVRHLKDIEIKLPEDKRTHLILTGRNGSGKTSVLEALRLWIWAEFEDNFIQSFILDNLKNDPLKDQFKFNGDKIEKFAFNYDDAKEKLQKISGIELALKNMKKKEILL